MSKPDKKIFVESFKLTAEQLGESLKKFYESVNVLNKQFGEVYYYKPHDWVSLGLVQDFHLSEVTTEDNVAKKNTEIVKAEDRALKVMNEIEVVKRNMVDNVFRLGELLAEIRNVGLYKHWGFDTYADWIAKSGLDMSERQSYYLIRIIENAKQLGIDSNSLKKVKMSKLKEIFALDPVKHGKEIKKLIEAGDKASLDDIKETVQIIQKGGDGEVYTYLNIKVLKSVKEGVIDPAIEIARREFGSTVNTDTGEVADISIGRALELICADYKADPNRQEPITVEAEQIPVEGEN